MKTVIKDITPQEAKQMLEHNPMNRKLNELICRSYAEQMKSGVWYSNGVPIIIDYEGNLKDGQHRLNAVIKSGVTMRNAVVIYINKDDAVCYDIGKVRSVKDTAALMGINSLNIKNTSIISMITFLIRRIKGRSSLVPKVWVIETIEKNEDLCDYIRINFINKCHQNNVRGLKNAGIIAALGAAYLNGYSLNELSHVCEVLTSGIIGNENDIGIIKIRDFLISNKFGGGRDFADETYFQMQRALKNHEKNIITKQLGKKREEYYKVPIDIMPEKYWE